MIRKYFLPILALLGVIVIIIAIVLDNQPAPVTGQVIVWPEVPFASYVSGAGMVEAGNGNIVIGTPVAGIVTDVFVKWGDYVKVGDPLFKIDERDVQAQRVIANASIVETKAKLTQARGQLQVAESIPDQRAVSREEVANRRSAVAILNAAWLSAQARAAQVSAALERLTIRALQPGKVLQMNIHPGEFAQAGALAKPLFVIGDVEHLSVRVDIDEFDASRVASGAAAVAFVRGAPHSPVPLKFVRIEPYVVPKTALTGSPTERVDSRILQVIYSFDAKVAPLYVGQQIDVYIESQPSPTQQKKLAILSAPILPHGAP